EEEAVIYTYILIKKLDNKYLGWSKAKTEKPAGDGMEWIKWDKELPEDIDTVYVAGGFGSNLRVDSIKTIGLLPNVPNKNIKPMGNTALAGAKMFLLSKRFRMKIEPILRKIRYVNLGGHKDFYKELVDAMYFPHKEKERFQT
ncbi:MAG: ASKHA domain-containing protein, partial [Candidatus Asgardarchaeia archaeon]